MIYLDYNATTPVDARVLEAMLPYLGDRFGNASSIHSAGQHARAAVDRARESVATLIGASPAEIVFTSGGTEADNLALLGLVAAIPCAKKHVITTGIEHHAVLNACQELERRGIDVTYVRPGSNGVVDPDDIRRAITPETVLISVMHANNEIGTIQPIEEIGRIADADIYFHCDAVQSAGKLPIDVNRLGVDLLSISAHKMYGPKGVGALYVRSGTPVEPLLFGGHHERDRRPGTENVPGIFALGKAAELARVELLDADAPRIAALRDQLETALLDAIANTRLNGYRAPRVCNTTNLTFPGAGGEALLIALDLEGIACSTGAACSSGAVEPSHVLTAIGLSDDEARSTLRFSLGRNTTRDEIDRAVEIIPGVVKRIRSLSPRSHTGVNEQKTQPAPVR
jgi:cysteine desulfurase